jgi:hypothetical protein
MKIRMHPFPHEAALLAPLSDTSLRIGQSSRFLLLLLGQTFPTNDPRPEKLSCCSLSLPRTHLIYIYIYIYIYIKLTNSVALVRERTIPTERPPLVGEVSTNFCG